MRDWKAKLKPMKRDTLLEKASTSIWVILEIHIHAVQITGERNVNEME